ncbi:hypothetical protein [Shewanella fidelis]|uniref:Uncharacterized protein n=1 Tax=Shewanella fidelis TaxID=173509 RepID=A0AAW8NJG0_9GAMM|nr:hypothetical protein [Shewanella fidelis]MDR8523348.1 hypothetical protein [Shewanella fidelis]MDW4811326.1 hypothetical protein [Shewanella fidelis]MDW4815447.1 hypothetical protein [Shewanella fidelis]MDW4819537.1 hypothetical protein [Shewanella fidelis]MDW4824489.1 hypothetical protein [Shewanella fidelis]
MELVICVILAYSSYLIGNSAFNAGLPVKRWAFLGLLVGPVAYPLLNSHKQLAYRKAMGKQGISICL